MFVAGFNRELEVKEESSPTFEPVQDNRILKYYVSRANTPGYSYLKKNLTSKKF